ELPRTSISSSYVSYLDPGMKAAQGTTSLDFSVKKENVKVRNRERPAHSTPGVPQGKRCDMHERSSRGFVRGKRQRPVHSPSGFTIVDERHEDGGIERRGIEG
ncbi:MAG: hypothetical protein L6R42_002188, partial [Xanthoria sp. 1 TBL-2021]